MEFLKSLSTLTVSETQNYNQKILINECIDFLTHVQNPYIDNVTLGLSGEEFNTIAMPANGFNFLELFSNQISSKKLIIYDTNKNSLNRLKSIYLNRLKSVYHLGKNDHPAELENQILAFRNADVEFVLTDIIESPQELATMLNFPALVHISNIFCSDFNNAVCGTTKTAHALKQFVSLLPSETIVVGKDAYGRPLNKKFN